MNSINSFTGLSMFELCYGRSLRVIPPLLNNPSVVVPNPSTDAVAARDFLHQINLTVREARDNLMLAKVVQAYQADKHHGPCELFEQRDLVMLLTYHYHEEFKKAGEKCAAKFFARFDGLLMSLPCFCVKDKGRNQIGTSTNQSNTQYASSLLSNLFNSKG
ncbi:hypothetical protein F5876DRAFT_39228 [Lentinula aff. lateritia]|uniref:Uncharacterized protein n=1 Tax=Lentinula aff. lateritia TaxID=2804960 RepID=A0ACC1U4K3_9AGAR|nr:hypothetical protein F5876DRAFT_39228 [Lentinula aff. lateritia]